MQHLEEVYENIQPDKGFPIDTIDCFSMYALLFR